MFDKSAFNFVLGVDWQKINYITRYGRLLLMPTTHRTDVCVDRLIFIKKL